MLDPTSTLIGAAIATIAWTALSFALASRKDRKAREKRRQFAEMQRAVFAVQDTAVLIVMDPPTTDHGRLADADRWQRLRAARDAAAAAYLEG